MGILYDEAYMNSRVEVMSKGDIYVILSIIINIYQTTNDNTNNIVVTNRVG